MLITKSGKRESAKGIELRNQEYFRTIRETENYKYLGILKADTIKQEEIKEKNNKSVPQKSSSAAEISLKRYTPGQSPLQDNLDHSQNGQVRNSDKSTKGQGNCYAQCFILERWNHETLCVKKRMRKRNRQHWGLCRFIYTKSWGQRKTNCSSGNLRTDRKTNTRKLKWGKTTVWIFQVTN